MMKIVGRIWRKLPASVRMKIVRVTQKKFTASVAAIVQNEKGEVLLLDHVLRPASGWGIPGGFLDFGEQPIDAVKRELREETGLELKELKIYRVRTIGRHIEIIFSAQAVGEASVKSREINGLGWFKVEEMPEKMSRIQKTMIEDLLRNNL
jgi:8-oxo-dGTP diphosphatase